MKINIITSCIAFFDSAICGIIKVAEQKGLCQINIIDIKQYGIGKHKNIDDVPYAGGGGMILRADVLESALKDHNIVDNIFLTSPRGKTWNQQDAVGMIKSGIKEITIISNRFTGVDQRVIDLYEIQEISIGDYILMGGDIACIVLMESVLRLIPNVLGNIECTKNETFDEPGFIQHDLYTRPSTWNQIDVPIELISGDHARSADWKKNNSSKKVRPTEIFVSRSD